MNKWHRRFIEMAKQVATWSKDPSTKVGAIIVDDHNRIISSGFNGFAKGVEDCIQLYEDKEYKHQVVLHAETNAIMFAVGPTEGCTLYVSFPPCAHCAAQIIQSGITTVVYEDIPVKAKWNASAEIAKDMYKQVGVRLVKLEV